MAGIALEFGDTHVASMSVEDMRWHSKQLVETERVPRGNEFCDLGGFGRRALPHLVAYRASLHVGQPGMSAGADVFMTELAVQSEFLGVLLVVERDRLRYG
jgi:hypothetical protein